MSSGSSAGENKMFTVIIKVYDPRVLNDRTATKVKKLWTLAAEQRALQDRACEGFQWNDDVLYEDDPDPDDEEGWVMRAANHEQNFFHLMIQCYNTERAAYERLHRYQGTALARLLGVGHWNVAPATRAIQPPVLVFEYIPGTSIHDIRPELIDSAMCVSLVAAVDTFASLGVAHADVHDGNILFTPQERPERAVIVDFGCAIVKEDSTSEEDWKEMARFEGDGQWIRIILKGKGVELPEL
ncbi:hypothetical protein DAEQUDRAFT_733693 [Daedalea quercina L-15889]|uniref:ABC1 atypical kinase-like domain-containing protein n=1 Tax=Daedalea quercina L-15889 TaxID=1314783 RepID=A0A165KSW0_9APHY|nr:hypothetical protein DAEQUDRAFT_733693 [Daedalea quercina L-15889]